MNNKAISIPSPDAIKRTNQVKLRVDDSTAIAEIDLELSDDESSDILHVICYDQEKNKLCNFPIELEELEFHLNYLRSVDAKTCPFCGHVHNKPVCEEICGCEGSFLRKPDKLPR